MILPENNIIKYLVENDIYFISILSEFNNDFTKIPSHLNFIPFNKENKIDSLVGYSSGGHFYLDLKDEYLEYAGRLINKKSAGLFSVYGRSETVAGILKFLKTKPKRNINYHVMILQKNDFIYDDIKKNNYYCLKCTPKDFELLKSLQYQYHKEEVYEKNSYYPYFAEMASFREILKNKLVYAVFTDIIEMNTKRRYALSKVNINGETPDMFQLGGIYTRKEYRKMGLSKICLNNIIKDIFENYDKKAIALFVKKGNEAAINLYLKTGFKKNFDTTLCYF